MTELTRRTVLGATATGVAVAAVGVPAPRVAAAPLGAVPAAAPRFTANRKLYRRKRFKAHRGSRFTVSGPGMRMRMKLVKVTNLPAAEKGSERSFALTFTAPRPGPDQGTFQLRRRRFKATSLFLVATDDTRRTYRAVVNNR
ncbi:DUF6916 family protein [Nocardioides daeguensis]|uniref:DUF6916 domain-containing protein n=1 Tax=Nocardioides daeguensis TaxID=908359 RepID=A0ABP6VRC2_9ACTN|nr:hypothetical protein [Nocardioides daeguensis]MBV6727456.1 hypothetical protein [Nocardioides daeguensis]MCR1773322.1 hypothetical protein [Nocardioides daeguensis]